MSTREFDDGMSCALHYASHMIAEATREGKNDSDRLLKISSGIARLLQQNQEN